MKGRDSPEWKKGKPESTNVKSASPKKILLLVILGVVAAVGGSIFALMNNQDSEVTNTPEREDVDDESTLGIGAKIALANQNVQNNCPSCSTAIVKPVFTHSAYQKKQQKNLRRPEGNTSLSGKH